MHSSLSLVVFVAFLVSFVVALPSPESFQKRNQVFKVDRVKNRNFAGHDGPSSLLKVYRKYGMPVPAGLVETVERRRKHRGGNNNNNNNNANAGNTAAANTTAAANGTGNGLVTATPSSGDVEYFAPINIGGQTLNMDFDSGSSDLWVFNTQLSKAAQSGHTIFDPSQSSTFSMIQGATFSISYGDGSGAAGNVGTDTVNIGGATVTSQAIELATAVSQSFVEDTDSNGLVGLAFSTLNTVQPQQQKTFFDNALDSLSEPVFTAQLKHATAGSYEFGTVDATKFTGDLAWAAVNTTNGFWQFSTDKFQVGTGDVQSSAGGQAIADTGTTLMIASTAVVDAYYSQVSGAQNDAQVGGVIFPCDADLPDLAVDVGGATMATVSGSFINFTSLDASTCFGGLQASTSDLQIFGDVFFKSNFIAFNAGNNSLGVAPHA